MNTVIFLLHLQAKTYNYSEAVMSHPVYVSELWLVQAERCGVGKPQSTGLDWRKGDLLVKS